MIHVVGNCTVDVTFRLERFPRPGETLIAYLTGLQQTSPVVPTGEPAPANPLAIVRQYREIFETNIYEILLDERRVRVTPSYVGLTPGLAGVYQINFTVPESQERRTTQVLLYRVFCFRIFGGCSSPNAASFSDPVTLPVR